MDFRKSKSFKVIIHVGIYAGILSFLHFFVATPFIFIKLKKKQEDYKTLEKESNKMGDLIRANPNPDKKFEEIKNKMKGLEKKATSGDALPAIIGDLTKISSELKVEIISIKPVKKVSFKEEKLPRGVSKNYVEVILKTEYKTLAEYFRMIEELPAIFTIESILIEKSETLKRRFAYIKEEGESGDKKKKSKRVTVRVLFSSYIVWKI